jgi:hypothetical protein
MVAYSPSVENAYPTGEYNNNFGSLPSGSVGVDILKINLNRSKRGDLESGYTKRLLW